MISTSARSPRAAGAMPRDDAEALAIRALAFVAADAALLPRFLSITGIEASQVRAAAREPGFLAGVLEFLLAHEPTRLAFAGAEGLDPAAVAAALRALPGGEDRHLVST